MPPSRVLPSTHGLDIVLVTLGIGMATAMNLFVFAVLYDALFSAGPGLSENATQVLTGWGGGIIGILGAAVGYRQSENRQARAAAEAAEEEST